MGVTQIALVGLGAAARTIHLPAYSRLGGICVVAACDPAGSAERFPFPVYESLDGMLADHQPDICVIASPTASHYPLALTLVERGIHVLCEKPFTERLDQAVDLVTRAKARGVRIAVNNEYRFMECHQAARSLIGDPSFGDLLFVNMMQTFRAHAASESGWRGDDAERTCKEFGTHVFDLSRYFFGTEPIRLRARMPRPNAPSEAGTPDMLNLIDLEFPRDRWARITLNRVTAGPHRYLDIRLDGTAGCIVTEMGGYAAMEAGLDARSRRPFLRADVSPGSRAFLYQGERRRKFAADGLRLFADATRRLMQGFVAALASGNRPPCDGSDNLRSFALMRAAYDSAAEDRDVDLGFLTDLP
jgi:predicted dehydrogenase